MSSDSEQVDKERVNGAVTLNGGSVPGDLPTPTTHPSGSDPTIQWLDRANHCFMDGLCGVHSPLLTASQLLSCPARSDMLKLRA